MKKTALFLGLGYLAFLAADSVIRYTPGDSGFVDYNADSMLGMDKIAASAVIGGVFLAGTSIIKV